jgi:hypothetical protein
MRDIRASWFDFKTIAAAMPAIQSSSDSARHELHQVIHLFDAPRNSGLLGLKQLQCLFGEEELNSPENNLFSSWQSCTVAVGLHSDQVCFPFNSMFSPHKVPCRTPKIPICHGANRRPNRWLILPYTTENRLQ